MLRQPFLMAPEIRRMGRAPCAIGMGFMDTRPNLVTIIGRCLLLWPQVELSLAILLAALLKTETRSAVAVYLTLRSTPRTKAITAAASMALSDKDKELCDAVLKSVRSAESERNYLAHGFFGTSDAIPDGLLWVSAQDKILFFVDTLLGADSNETDRWDELSAKLSVYREADLLAVERQILEVETNMYSFVNYVRLLLRSQELEQHQELYDRICNQAPIREALLVLRAGAQKKSSSEQP
jgi:hypothetical protein